MAGEGIRDEKRLYDIIDTLVKIGHGRGVSAAQVALAWLLSRGTDIVPIPGTKRRKYLEENLAAANLVLSAEELAQLSAAFPPGVTAGTRYPEKQLKALGI